MANEVRLARLEDAPGMGRALGLAFADDPVLDYFVPRLDLAVRGRRLGPFFAAESRTKINTASAWTTADHAGAALWAAPGRWKTTMRENLTMAWPFLRVAARNALRAFRGLSVIERAHPHTPHWYLATLGTAPDRQGHGVGSALIQPVLERCDADGEAAYLESSKESNVPYYERFGFKVIGEIHLPDGGPTLWPMWRDPQP
ncbi:MAG: GNAT family N-acetyltransferase [Acidimicrobiales bacterium]